MRAGLFGIVLGSLIVVLLSACGGGDEEETPVTERPAGAETPGAEVAETPTVTRPTEKATLRINATDAPPRGVTKILITVSQIEVQKADADAWQVAVPGPITFDLVEIEGVEKTLGETQFDPGSYGQIRLQVDAAEVTVEGSALTARVPSGKLKIVGGFSLKEGETIILTLDFDANRSVVVAGPRNVLIKPVIKLLVREEGEDLNQARKVGEIAEELEETPVPVPTPTSAIAETPTAAAPAQRPRPSPVSTARKGSLRVNATDAPPQGVSKILVAVSQIEVQKAGGDAWQVVVPGPVEFDLVEIEGVETTLGEAELDVGLYGQIRLEVNKVEVTILGATLTARVPSGKLKIVGGFSVKAGVTTVLTLDFDADKSVVVAGTRNVLIKPVIKLLVREEGEDLDQAQKVGEIEESATSSPEITPVSAAPKPTLTVAEHPELGTILVDGEGFTVYLFMQDGPNESNCTGGCAQAWPPLIASEAQPGLAGQGVDADLVGTTTRDDGSLQVTYNKHPLYNFSADREPGDTRGQAVGRVWFALSPEGESVE